MKKKLSKQKGRVRNGMTRIRRNGRAGAAVLKKRRYLRDAAIVMACFVAISLFCVWSRLAVLQTGYRIHDLTSQYEGKQEEYRALQLELATRKSPTRLAPLAQKRLGLTQPNPDQIVVVPASIHLAEQGQ